MDYLEVVDVFERLEQTASTLAKTDILSALFSKTRSGELKTLVYLSMGKIFPDWMQKELWMGDKLVISALSRVYGVSKDDIVTSLKTLGGLGLVAEKMSENRSQSTLFQKELDLDEIGETLKKISDAEGTGAQDKKISLLAEILSPASPKEAKYIVRIVLGQLRMGVGEGVIRDAVSKSFSIDKSLVERTNAILNDYGETAELALKGEKELRAVSMKVGRPIKVMLFHKSEGIETALDKCGGIAGIEPKLDGFRTQIHKSGQDVKIFTRRLDDVTKQFPEVAERARQSIKSDSAIVEGETIGYDAKTGKWLPFQSLSNRIKRKHDIDKKRQEVPVATYLFDIVFLNGKNLLDIAFKQRRTLLESVVDECDEFRLMEKVITNSSASAERFYKKQLAIGHEGVMVKNLEAPYKPGQRTGYGYKVKPIMETLDLVIIGAEWGEGRRARWLSSFLMGARHPETAEFLSIGKMATGLTDKQFQQFTDMLKPFIEQERGKRVYLRPHFVIEVAYEEIQESPTYKSGFALRFPRFVRLKEDRNPEDADTIDRVKYLYDNQRGRK
ncbi:MAG: ATP-dependent DNA ligase [Candidatus Altiarchaeota archaeon]|nr:ATP-dependent DNA ligase [Candidatus Altiarchaeota archaeon]